MNKVMNNQPIGVFDSGLGGLNVLKELRKELPHEHFIYLGDTKRFPYGNKSSQAIIDIARDNVNFFMAFGFSNNEINRDFKIEDGLYKNPFFRFVLLLCLRVKRR